jgi:tRNA(fMet)-specific endonuclease VapC
MALTPDETVTSVVVAGELRAWIAKTGSARLERLIATTLVAVPVLPLGPEVADIYGEVWARLQRAGTLIGSNDLWIAAHALSLGAVMVTDNVREFGRVPDLPLDNWLRQ